MRRIVALLAAAGLACSAGAAFAQDVAITLPSLFNGHPERFAVEPPLDRHLDAADTDSERDRAAQDDADSPPVGDAAPEGGVVERDGEDGTWGDQDKERRARSSPR
jgi:hypothetical protein